MDETKEKSLTGSDEPEKELDSEGKPSADKENGKEEKEKEGSFGDFIVCGLTHSLIAPN